MTDNQQRAAEVLWPLGGEWEQNVAEVAAALDVAEARGEQRKAAEVAAKIEALAEAWDHQFEAGAVTDYLRAATRLRALAAEVTGRQCGCRTHKGDRCAELGCDCIAEDTAAYDPGQFSYDDDEAP